MSDYVSEAGHWYTKDGLPAYTQLIASGVNKGKERPTTLRDAKKLGLVPSVTTINSILDKPALTYWKVLKTISDTQWSIYQALEEAGQSDAAAYIMEELHIEEPDGEDKAARGAEIHGAIEKWLGGGGVDEGYEDYIEIVSNVLNELGVSLTDVVAERSFTSPLGYGGAVDLSTDGGSPVIIDFKTKDMDEKKAERKLAYDEHAMQLAAYRRGLNMPTARCFNLFLSRDNPKVYALHEWEEAELVRAEQMFFKCFELWKLQKRYDPCLG